MNRHDRSALAFVLAVCAAACATTVRPAAFTTPEDAVRALVDTQGDRQRAEQILGSQGLEMLSSGDEVADRQDAQAVREMAMRRIAFEDLGEDRKVALLGDEGWPLPIPLVREAGGWTFDVAAGQEELHTRRIGRNELSTLATLHALVDAQREYALEGRDGFSPAFARRILSEPGEHDGLYWPVSEGEPDSPLGPLVAEAAAEGYRREEGAPLPYHGYHYRILTAQGPSAPGGERSYLDAQGLMTGGFAALAWPASYGNSGIMTFMVNQQGLVFQKDIGPETAGAVERIERYDPDASWTPTGD